ncbi:interferon-inducible GTPase 5-like [Sceloporus undulatus]|uniref:interferon-inducible GTPase 5-like n=1 Tax=Sceloporus undulatus TaxID=8520 RepID=UPI001C4B798F|nr:interferon-inducible GTPase 5-like [Sceloporus undulatus]
METICLLQQCGARLSNPKVFLVSNYETSRFDFPLLRGKLKNDLLKLKRQAFLLSLPSIYLPVLDKKKTAMNRQILTRAFWLWFIVLIPIPGLSFFPAMKVHSWCYHKFGLDDQSLTALAQMVGKTATTFKAAMKPMTLNSVNLWSLTELMRVMMIIGDYYYRQHFPFLGCLLSGGISLCSTYFLLKKFVSDGANDTHSVLTEALVREEKKSI